MSVCTAARLISSEFWLIPVSAWPSKKLRANSPTSTGSYHGNTAVNGGTLAFSQATLPTDGIVSVANGAALSLNFAGTNRVAGLLLNGESQLAGLFNAANSSPYLSGSGSLLVAEPVATGPTNIIYSLNGTSLTLSWPADHTRWHLQTQTNFFAVGLSTNWMTVSNSTTTNEITVPLNATNGSVFFRLVYP